MGEANLIKRFINWLLRRKAPAHPLYVFYKGGESKIFYRKSEDGKTWRRRGELHGSQLRRVRQFR